MKLGVEDPPTSRTFIIGMPTSDLRIWAFAVISSPSSVTWATSSAPPSISIGNTTQGLDIAKLTDHFYDCVPPLNFSRTPSEK